MSQNLRATIGGRIFALAPLKLGLLRRVKDDLVMVMTLFSRSRPGPEVWNAMDNREQLAASIAFLPNDAELTAVCNFVFASANRADPSLTRADFDALVDDLDADTGYPALVSACLAITLSSGVTQAEGEGAALGEAPAPSTA